MLLNRLALKTLAKGKNKRLSKDYIEYLNKRVEKILLDHIHMTGRMTLKARDFIFLDAINKGR